MLFRKMLRDMKMNITPFLSIFLMSFLGLFIYSGVGGEWYGLDTTVNKYYDETNLSDVWLYSPGFSNNDVDNLLQLEEISEVERRLTLKAVAEFDNNPSMTLHFIEKNEISTCTLIEGEEFSLEKDGVWLDNEFAKAMNLKVSDKIIFTLQGMDYEKEILGLVINPEYVYHSENGEIIPNHANYGFAFLSYKSFPEYMDIFYTDILIKCSNDNPKSLEQLINDTISTNINVFLTRNSNQSYLMFSNEVQQHRAMGAVFPIAFLAIALLTILTTMTRLVNNQRTQIGTLKALGFKKQKILYHYISYGFVLSLIGSIAGAIVGPFTLPYLFFPSMETAYTLPEWKPALLPSSIIMIVLSVVLCTLVTYLACKNLLKDSPAITLQLKSPKISKHSKLEKTKLWNSLGFNLQWNIRDIWRSKLRSLMAIVGVVGCMGLLVCAFGMNDSIADILDWQYKELNIYESKLSLEEDISSEEINTIINNVNGESIVESVIEIKSDDFKKTAGLTVTDNVSLIHYTDKQRNQIVLPRNGISISYKLANSLDVSIGDKVKWHMYGNDNWITSYIKKIYRDPTNQGISMSKSYFEELGFNYHPTSIISSQIVDTSFDGVSNIYSLSELSESYEDMMEAMNIMIYILIFGAAILAVVVLYNLGVLSFAEKQREFATLKVLGFKSAKIRKLLLTQNIILSVIGLIPGILLGKWLIYFMCRYMGDSFDMMPIINPISYAYSILITLFLSVFVNFLFSMKINKIDMVSSLKGME